MTLGRTAWTRIGSGRWQPFAMTTGSVARGVCVVPEQQEDELRAFLSLVTRRTPRTGEVAWALRRFELACDRPRPSEALTDVLLALRALLEPEGPQSGRLPGRLSALCAMPAERAAMAERTAHAVSLERAVVAGQTRPDPHADHLVDELATHARALLS